jgi:chloramphenicol 3-O-phosphotransferase
MTADEYQSSHERSIASVGFIGFSCLQSARGLSVWVGVFWPIMTARRALRKPGRQAGCVRGRTSAFMLGHAPAAVDTPARVSWARVLCRLRAVIA